MNHRNHSYYVSWQRNYLMIVSTTVALVATIGFLSYLLDFGEFKSNLGFVTIGVCTLAGYVCVRRWVKIIKNRTPRSFVYYVFLFGVLLSSLILSGVTHKLRHPMDEFATMHDAIQSGEEYFYVKKVEIDTSRHGIFTTSRIWAGRHNTDIEYITFVTYQIKNLKNVFWGYTLNSAYMSPKDNKKRDTFIASLDEKIKNHAIPNGEGYYRRVMPNEEDYDAFVKACIISNISIKSPVFVRDIKSSTKDSIKSELTMIVLIMFASFFIILLVFLFVKKEGDQLPINKIKRENYMKSNHNQKSKTFPYDSVEEIRIYHSPWRIMLLVLVCMVFTAASIALLLYHTRNAVQIFFLWAGIIFFGLGGIKVLVETLREYLMHKPFLTITDKSIIRQSIVKKYVIHFDDVELFEVVKLNNQELIAIHYKSAIEFRKIDEGNIIERSLRLLNHNLINAQETITTIATGINTQELCDLLNKRRKMK